MKGAVSEVKNVKSQDFTKQLGDHAQFAQKALAENLIYTLDPTRSLASHCKR
ncbi:putative toxin [Xanthomonas euvesicatoria]|uniref:putative toxin n=1 Tax=Xanthomonas euvesicatoria TaxID=456327 RepID=UPI003A0FBE14